MAKTEIEIVEPAESTELVTVEGVMLDLWADSDSTFVSTLKKDMPIAARTKAVREVAQKVTHMEDRLHSVMGEMLYEISSNRYWKNWKYKDEESGEKVAFTTFDEYIEKECEVKRRTAYYYISVYEKFIIELGIPAAKMRTLEWSKAKELIGIINKENWSKLLADIKGMTVRQVRSYVADKKGVALPKGEVSTDTKNRLTFQLTDEQYESVQQALKVAESLTTSDKQGNLLDTICTSFVAESGGSGIEAGLIKLDTILRSLERTFAVTLELKNVDDDRYASLREEPVAAVD